MNIRMIVDYCSCCLSPADLCQNSPPVSTYEVICPAEEVIDNERNVATGVANDQLVS